MTHEQQEEASEGGRKASKMEMCDASAPYKKYSRTSLFVRGNCCNSVDNNDDDSSNKKLDGGDNADMDDEDRSWI